MKTVNDLSETKFRTIFENLSDEVLYIDKYGVVIDVNRRGEEMFGYPKSEIMGKNLLTAGILSPKELPKIIKLHHQLLSDRTSKILVETEVLHKDGHLIPVELSVSLIFEDDKISGILILVKDISERKRIQDEILKMASVVKFSINLVNIADVNGKMLFLNSSGQHMLGINENDVTNNSILDIIDNSSMELVTKELLPKLKAGKSWEGELVYRNMKDKNIINAYASCFPITDPKTGDLLYFANVSNNIDKQKIAEKNMIEELEHLQSLNNLMVGRELRMAELKQKIASLESELSSLKHS